MQFQDWIEDRENIPFSKQLMLLKDLQMPIMNLRHLLASDIFVLLSMITKN